MQSLPEQSCSFTHMNLALPACHDEKDHPILRDTVFKVTTSDEAVGPSPAAAAKAPEVAIEAARAESLPPSRVNRQVEKGSSQGAPIAPSPLILLSERCPTQFLEPRSFRKSRLGGGHSTKCGVGDDHVHLLNSESCLLKR